MVSNPENPGTMEEAPEVPSPPPEIPRGKLWTSLLLPLGITFIGSVIAAMVAEPSTYGRAEFLVVLPVGLVAILVCLAVFISAWRVRYRGTSLVLTGFGFLLGQVILCLALWFGCCVYLP